jgi:hypothetical protein
MSKLDKVAIKMVMSKYLKSIGYPNISNERIIKELPTLFRLLDSEKLIPKGMTFDLFHHIAINKYMETEIMGGRQWK